MRSTKTFATLLAAVLAFSAGISSAGAAEPAARLESRASMPSPGTALALSLGTTAGATGAGLALVFGAHDSGLRLTGLGLLGSGLLLLPSTGHAYAGDWSRAGLFTLGRAAALGVCAWGAAEIVGSMSTAALGPSDEDQTSAEATFVVGGLALVGLAAWEIVDTPFSVRADNERSAIAVSPLIAPDRESGRALGGLMAQGTF